VEGMTDIPAPSIWPALAYADAPAAIRFLVEAFGFVETLVVPGDDGREIAHAELRWPEGGGVMLGSTSDDSVFGRMKPGMTSIYVVTDAPDAVFQRATAAGAEVVRVRPLAGLPDLLGEGEHGLARLERSRASLEKPGELLLVAKRPRPVLAASGVDERAAERLMRGERALRIHFARRGPAGECIPLRTSLSENRPKRFESRSP